MQRSRAAHAGSGALDVALGRAVEMPGREDCVATSADGQLGAAQVALVSRRVGGLHAEAELAPNLARCMPPRVVGEERARVSEPDPGRAEEPVLAVDA